MAFLLPLLEGGAELLGEAGGESLAEQLGIEGVGKELAGAAGAYAGKSLFGSFLPSDDEEKMVGGLLQRRVGVKKYNYTPNTIPLKKVFMTEQQLKNNESIPYQPVEPNKQPIGFRLHYKPEIPKIGVIKVPNSYINYSYTGQTTTPYRTSNSMYGNTGGFS